MDIKEAIVRGAIKERARRSFIHFVQYTKADYSVQWFHVLLAQYLQQFALGLIKKLMIFMPPQHGKSELVSRRLVAYLLGLNPTLKIVGASYSSVLSTAFNRDIKRIIGSDEYQQLFPHTKLNAKNVSTDAKGAWLNNSEIFEVMNFGGFYKNVGVGGSVTGTTADVGIIDDPVKGAAEADSLTMRTMVWNWYENDFISRMHNGSRVLLTMTRWHVDDLAGRILQSEDAKNWVVLKLPAIKTEATHHPEDKRRIGEALWENRHSAEKIRMNSERVFEALYQQNPLPTKGGLVYPDVVVIDKMPDNLEKQAIGIDWGYSNGYTTAMLCGIKGKNLYIDQILYEKYLLTDAIYEKLKPFSRLEAFADCEDSRLIEEVRRKGLIMLKAVKKEKGSVLGGIALLREYNIHITRRSFGIIAEQQKYCFVTDGYGNPTNEPQKGNDHAWDAVRYYALSKLSKPERSIIFTR